MVLLPTMNKITFFFFFLQSETAVISTLLLLHWIQTWAVFIEIMVLKTLERDLV